MAGEPYVRSGCWAGYLVVSSNQLSGLAEARSMLSQASSMGSTTDSGWSTGPRPQSAQLLAATSAATIASGRLVSSPFSSSLSTSRS
jgi:hypothetical protein